MLKFSRRLYPLSMLALGCMGACLPAPYIAAQSFRSSSSSQATAPQTKSAASAAPSAAASAAPSAALPAAGDTDLIVSQEGTLPIILSAPHGGQLPIPDGTLRRGEGMGGGAGFVTVRDVNTDRLALALASAIETRMGKKPYYVVAHFQRRYADPNRPPYIATEDAASRRVYDAYHQKLAEACKAVKLTWGRGLLIDIHGQGAARDTIFRGTNDGRTTVLLTKRYGAGAIDGPNSLPGLLMARGCKVFPATSGVKENPSFSGGFIVQMYGSHEGYGIDAMQLEFGADYTSRAKIAKTAEILADATAEYARLYLPDKPLEKLAPPAANTSATNTETPAPSEGSKPAGSK